MTRFLFLLSVVFAVVTAAPFLDLNLPVADHETVTVVTDISGLFKKDDARSDESCPRRIMFAGVDAGSTEIPHSDITVDGTTCSDSEEEETLLFTSAGQAKREGSFPSNIKKILNDFNAADVMAVYGVDIEGLECGGTTIFNPKTLFIFLTVVGERTKVIDNFYDLDKRYMIIYDGTTVCRYQTNLLPSIEPSPSVSASPSVSPSPGSTMEASPSPSASVTPTPSLSVGASPSPSPDESQSPSIAETDTAEVSPTETDDDGSVCFPADAQVTLEDGSTKTMSNVQVGDRVLVSGGLYSEVYMFTHKQQNTKHQFVSLTTDSGAVLEATKSHYIYINGRFAAASTARVGDTLELGNGARSAIVSVSRVTKMGLYNPQTVHGDIVVNSIRASTFTRTVEPYTAQALLMPLRAAYAAIGWSTSAFNNGADNLAALLPRGQTAL